MQCQIEPGCTNVGVHSCDQCGLLACGKHAELRGMQPPLCATCYAPIRANERSDAKMANGCVGGGCLFMVLGLAIAAILGTTEFGVAGIIGGFIVIALGIFVGS